uniref:Uncharacterized protein n=1 Tax=virus sp. ctmTa7 TaxID=2828255 RepID=A0A8S5RBT5_9VIRU|nr:MAG TPA: hypothetical protein [virus sp. ctmTa7]
MTENQYLLTFQPKILGHPLRMMVGRVLCKKYYK